jgi:DNA-binding response OmpR family regulator
VNDPRLCPHCGYDLVRDAPILLNDFSMLSSMSPLCYLGQPIKLTPAERNVAWTIFKSYPRAVTIDVILDRLESEAEGNVIDVYLSRIRTKLREIGAPIPFEAAGGKLGRRAVSWRIT